VKTTRTHPMFAARRADGTVWESEEWLQKYGKPEEKEELSGAQQNGAPATGDE
jgi:hypothetical protein